MSVFAYNRFVSVLALFALAGAVGLVVARVAAPTVVRQLRPAALWLAFLVALASTAGSLIYSEMYHFEPCRLCWYQRIAMYPLALILGIAAFRRDAAARRYVVPLATAGLAVAAYHYLIEWYPGLDSGACGTGVPCTARYVEEFGFVSIAFMALSGFAAIISLLTVTYPGVEKE
jgi:disulfide bond formation protein DsbB